MERLQRILSSRGVASRRVAEEMIVAGRVSVNDKVVTELGTKADPDSDVIRVDGRIIRPQRRRYIMLNKPRGFITTTSDERDRQTVMELVQTPERLYPVGRLDRDTEGLLLLTNDGDLANRVMHPRFGLEKEYHILTTLRPTLDVIERVRRGVEIDGRRVTPNEFRIFRETRDGIILTISLHEGMYHVVRRMMDAAGIPVERLTRVRVGPLMIAGVPVGHWRDLSPGEEKTLFEAVHMDLSEEEAAQRRSGEIRSERERFRPREQPGRPARFAPGPPVGRDRRPRFERDGQAGPRDARPDQRPDRPPRRDDRGPRPEQPYQQQPRKPRRFNPQRDLGQYREEPAREPRSGDRPQQPRQPWQDRRERPEQDRRFERSEQGSDRPFREGRPPGGPRDRRYAPGPERNEPRRDHTGRPVRHHADRERQPGNRDDHRERRSGPAEREQRMPTDQRGRRVNQRSSGREEGNYQPRREDRPRDQRGFGPRRDDRPDDRRQSGPRRDERGGPPRERQNQERRSDRSGNRPYDRERPWRPADRPRDAAPRKRRADDDQRVRQTRRNDERRGAPARHDRPNPRPPAGDRDRRPGRGGQNDRGARSGRPDRSDAL